MLTARRFTTVPTKDTRSRLEDAHTNHRPIARGEPHRGAVVAVQAALSDLNRGYLLAAEIDGYFGPRTYAAVESFQRDYGLAADGIVGRQSLTQLDELFSAEVIREPVGRSIHIGVDRLEPGHYGDTFDLPSCVNDARKMKEIAEGIGYDAVLLENEEATVSNFTGFMRTAIADLYAGDALLVTFSGHGSQLPNTSSDEEADLKDETLCFYDRMLIDDEFYALLTEFREGVQVHAVFDSCHSGTVAKYVMMDVEHDRYREDSLISVKSLSIVGSTVVRASESGDVDSETEKFMPITSKSIGKALEGAKPKFAKAEPKEDRSEEIADFFADLYKDVVTGKAKSIEFFSPIYDANKSLYDAVKSVVGDKEKKQLLCAVVTLSACQDSQTTPAGQVYSLFTYNVMSAWGSGFEGSYDQFHRNLRNAGRADATPAINTYGAARANARLRERPFVF